MSFVIGQIFENEYPPELSSWCGENNAFVEELNNVGGPRRFQIVSMPELTFERQQELIQERLTEAIQEHLDSKAQELLYDSCLSVCSYVDTGVPKFDAEGRAFRSWRSAVWQKGYEILAAVIAGQRGIPTEDELLAELPKLNLTY